MTKADTIEKIVRAHDDLGERYSEHVIENGKVYWAVPYDEDQGMLIVRTVDEFIDEFGFWVDEQEARQ